MGHQSVIRHQTTANSHQPSVDSHQSTAISQSAGISQQLVILVTFHNMLSHLVYISSHLAEMELKLYLGTRLDER
jgi:hypothetical protein